ncbi:MAG: glucosamine-6-phosphate deaminase [Bacteriovoracaceae bacterium]
MKILSFKATHDLEKYAATLILNEVQKKPRLVLGLATGRTMVGVYQELVHLAQNTFTSFKEVTTFNLDEYVGLSELHPASFHSYMNEKLFSHLSFDTTHCFLPRGMALNAEAEALRYENEIQKSGGIDFQLLGLGQNAHIGFNEPGSSFHSRTRLVQLSPATKAQNLFAFSDGQIPDTAISMGLATIMRSKKILLVVTGASKAVPLRDCLADVNEYVPASILQRHAAVTILADEEALSLIPESQKKLITRTDHNLP